MCVSYTPPTTFWGKVAEKILDAIFWLERVSTEYPWTSWLMHALVAIPIALIFGTGAVLAVFLVRELEQIALQVPHLQEPWYDYILDVAAPVIVALLIG